MNIKKRVSLILLAGMLATVSLGAVSASANNHYDEDFHFSYSDSSTMQFSRNRVKDDATSGYVKCNSGQAFYAHIFSPYHSEDLSQTTPYVRPGAGGYYILNRAYESGYREVCLGGITSSGNSAGVWSPDSV